VTGGCRIADRVGDGVDGLHLASENDYDAVILDVLLPSLNGYRVCGELRQRGADVPVLMLTAKAGSWDETEGLDTGADDYMVKPFHYPVLLARLRALLRRGPARLPPVLAHRQLRLDPARHHCTLDGDPLELTPKEFALLRFLMANPGVTHANQDLLQHVWGDVETDHNIVQVFVSGLRRKIDGPDRPSFLCTVRGVGYRLADDS
jgi:DNA-binding response OmpR family regulator